MKIAALLVLLSLFNQTSGQTDTCLIHSEIGMSFPPVADAIQRDFAQTHLDSLDIKKIRFAEDWSLREPSQGNYNWSPLDERLTWASNNNYEVLLTIQSKGPAWACGQQNPQSCVFSDNNDFKTYIDTLLKRYPNQIDKIQFGNEWQADFWYVGNAQEFIDANNVLYTSVQTHAPNTDVVLGGFTTISLRFLAGCNGIVNSFYDDDGNFYDSAFLATNCPTAVIQTVKARIDSVIKLAHYNIIDLHLYDDSEQWDEYYMNFTDTISTPIIVSEFGGPNVNIEPASQNYHANRVYDYIKKLDSLQISEIYYFKLVEGTANPAHAASGLIDDTTLLAKEAYQVVKAFTACQPVGIEEHKLSEIQCYPNPANNHISLEFDQMLQGPKLVKVYRATGQLLLRKEDIYDTSLNINTTDFQNGWYYVEVTAENGALAGGKFVVQR